MRKTLIAFLLLILFSEPSLAQAGMDKQEIATDYNSCLKGIKDSLGNWIVQPYYEGIEATNGKYIVRADGKYGLLSRKGKILIPPTYDYLRGFDSWILRDYFCATLYGKDGVVDTLNHIIVPIRYERVHASYDSTFVAKRSGKRYDFYNMNGTCFPCPWKTRDEPDQEAEGRYVIERWGVFHHKYGLVSDSGKIILPRKYTDIDGHYFSHALKISRHRKFGYCNTAGKIIWPIIFHYPGGYDPSNYRSTFPAVYNGKYGLINFDGDTILPFKYDYIGDFSRGYSSSLWEVQVDSLYGVFDAQSGWLLQPTCTFISEIATFTNSIDTTRVALLTAEMNGKFGAMTTSGQIVIPFVCDQYTYTSRGNYVFLKGDSLLCLGVSQYNEVSSFREAHGAKNELFFLGEDGFPNMFSVPADNKFRIFKGKEGVRVYYNPEETTDTIHRNDSVISIVNGGYYGMNFPDSILVASAFYVIPLKPVADYERVDFYAEPYLTDTSFVKYRPEFCLLHLAQGPDLTTFSNYYGSHYVTSRHDVVKQTGEIIILGDTVGDVDAEKHYNNGDLYFTVMQYDPFRMCAVDTNGKTLHPYSRREFDEFSDRYTWYETISRKYDGYNLVDNQTGKSVFVNKELSDDAYPIWDSITLVSNEKSGVRLYNIKRQKYFTSYGCDEIIPLTVEGSLFGVETCMHHYGVCDAKGNFLLDTLYDAISFGDGIKNISTWSGLRHGDQFYGSAVFYNDREAWYIDLVTHKAEPFRSVTNMLWGDLVHAYNQPGLEKFLCDSMYFMNGYHHFRLFISAQDSSALEPWQKQILIDSVYQPHRTNGTWYRYRYHCRYCRTRSARGYYDVVDWSYYGNESQNFMLGYQNDSLLSFYRIRKNYYSDTVLGKYSFSTVMLFPDGVHCMTLDSLFDPASDWRNFIINTLLNYVNTHKNITGDCHYPAAIPGLLNEHFEITPEGLLLYPPGFSENSHELKLLITWKDVDPYLRMDIRRHLPVH